VPEDAAEKMRAAFAAAEKMAQVNKMVTPDVATPTDDYEDKGDPTGRIELQEDFFCSASDVYDCLTLPSVCLVLCNSACSCIYIYLCMYIHIHAHICKLYQQRFRCLSQLTFGLSHSMHMHVRAQMCICTFVCTCVQLSMRACAHTHTHIHIHTNAHTHIHTNIRAHTH